MASSRTSNNNLYEDLMKGLNPYTSMDELLIEEGITTPNEKKESSSCRCNSKALRDLKKLKVLENRRFKREKLKRARLRRRLRRKELRQRRKEKRLRKERRRKKLQNCSANNNDQSVNCFTHDNDHWKTAPFWTDGYFCACTNSNTNTYWCLRTVNDTHNYLYCEFVSGIITYYDLNVDPYQLRNIYQTLNDVEINTMHKELQILRESSGDVRLRRGGGGEGGGHKEILRHQSSSLRKHRRRFRKRKQKIDFNDRFGQFLPPVEAYYKKL